MKKRKRVIISGLTGQDGSYLAEYLLSKDYEVHGIIRRQSVTENQQSRIDHLKGKLNVVYSDLLDTSSLERIFKKVRPDEIYNLAAMSHVRVSFDIPQFTAQTNAIGVLNMLEAYRTVCPKAKFYQASSSEQFGLNVDADKFQRETTPFNPTSPYGVAKVFAYHMVRHYRRAYNLFAVNGILFNHLSPRRGSNFVMAKIVKAACKIKLGMQNKLELGNMDTYRDFGNSKDYVKGMYKIMHHSKPDDFVIASMKTYSIRDACELVFKHLNMDYKDYVIQNPKYMRPEELPYLRGDSTKARTILKWKPEYTFESSLHEMIEHWMDVLQGKVSIR